MNRKTMFLLVVLCSLSTVATAQDCTAISASVSGGWKPISSAPRDGTMIETVETYGVAPWYGRYKWIKKGTVVHTTSQVVTPDGKVENVPQTYLEPEGRWARTDDPRHSLDDTDPCLFWRPTSQTEKYTDPPNGAQNTVAYWCAAMHRPYDKKRDVCK